VIHAVLVLGAAVLWGTTGTAQALGPDGLDPLVVGSGRLVLGGGLLAAFATATFAWRLRRDHRRRRGARIVGSGPSGGKRARHGRAIAVAAVCVAAYQLCFFVAVARTGVAVGTLIAIGSAPVFTGIVAGLAGQGRPGRVWAVATALAVAGCAALTLAGAGGSPEPTTDRTDLLGVGLALTAGLSYAGYTVGSKRLVATMGATGAMAAIFGGAGLLLLPVFVGRVAVETGAWTGGMVAVVVYLGVVPTALAYVLFGHGLAGLRPPVVATLSLAEPLVAAILGVALLGETVTPLQLVGAALIFAGLAASVWSARAQASGDGHAVGQIRPTGGQIWPGQ
jgi:drug/metabolite transporter, DME family